MEQELMKQVMVGREKNVHRKVPRWGGEKDIDECAGVDENCEA